MGLSRTGCLDQSSNTCESSASAVAIYMSSGRLAAVGRVVRGPVRSVIQLEKVVASQARA